jgi:hypothetical protein
MARSMQASQFLPEAMASDLLPEVASGATGPSLNIKHLPEELAQTLDKIVTQMDVLTRTVVLLDRRIDKFDGYVAGLARALERSGLPYSFARA